MPKPVDEDRARRKELLEQKRLARKAEKERKAAEKKEASESVKQKATFVATGPSPLLQLPDESFHCILSFLAAPEVARVVFTSKTTLKRLETAQISLVQNRLRCSEAHARDLLASEAGGDTGRLAPKKFAPTQVLSYLKFLDESQGFATLSRRNNMRQRIALPQHTHGRICSVSPEHTLCRVGQSMGLASWGVGRRGQLGHGKRQDERHPRRLLELGYSVNIVQVAAGGGLVRVAHSLLLTETGRVLSFGTGQYGALGHGYSAAKQLPDILRPKYIQALDSVITVYVAAGELHSAVVTADGDVYTWGDGFCGQLGHGDKRPQLSPKQVESGGLDDEVVATICCGSRHTIAITEDGEAYTWGLGHFGVLGRSYTPFDYDADAAVVNFVGDADAPQLGAAGVVLPPVGAAIPPPMAAVEDRGERNLAEEIMEHIDLIANLSLDDSSDQCIPTVVDSLKDIKLMSASAGHRHTLLLDTHGQLYACGAGKTGCLGLGDTETHGFPMRINFFAGENVKICQMSAGVDMSMAVSDTGDVYAWGKTDSGRIGLGLGFGDILLPRRVTVKTENEKEITAVDVECGYVHSIIVGADGTLFMCGGVGVEGDADGQASLEQETIETELGKPRPVNDLNVWHRLPAPKDKVERKSRWKKFGKYEVKGRSKMLNETSG